MKRWENETTWQCLIIPVFLLISWMGMMQRREKKAPPPTYSSSLAKVWKECCLFMKTCAT